MAAHQSFVTHVFTTSVLESFMFDAAASVRSEPSPPVAAEQVFQEVQNYGPMMPIYQRNMQLGMPQLYYRAAQWVHLGQTHVPWPEHTLQQQAEDTLQQQANCQVKSQVGPGEAAEGQPYYAVTQGAQPGQALVPQLGQAQQHPANCEVKPQAIPGEAAETDFESSAQKLRKGIRNKAMKKTDNGIEIVDDSAIPNEAANMSMHSVSGISVEKERQSQQRAQNNAMEETGQCVGIIDACYMSYEAVDVLPPCNYDALAEPVRGPDVGEPTSSGGFNVLECSGMSDWVRDWTPADVSSPCVVGPPGLGHRRAYRSPAKRNRDSARFLARGFGKPTVLLSSIEEQECERCLQQTPVQVTKGAVQDSLGDGFANKDGEIEQSTIDGTQVSSGTAAAEDPPTPFSISAMLKWRSVTLGVRLPENVVVCSAMCVDGDEHTPNNWREEAAHSQQKKKKAKGFGKGLKGKKWQTYDSPQQELTESVNSWSAKQKQLTKSLNNQGKSDEEIVRTMKSILNKLTMKKYDTLYQQILDCGMSTVEHVTILIDEVLEKAQTQHHFIQMYCQLCIDLHKWCVERCICSFKRILLNQCQNKFEDNLLPPDLSAVNEHEVEEAMSKHKLAMLGNIKFIGALLEKGMLNDTVLVPIAWELCDAGAVHTLESLACFLTAVGPTFDHPHFKGYEHLQAIFVQVDEKSKEKSIATRIRFLLRDLLDLRKAGWSSSSSSSSSTGPAQPPRFVR